MMSMLTFDGDFEGFFGADNIDRSLKSLGIDEYCLCHVCPHTSGDWVCDYCKLKIENKQLHEKVKQLEEKINDSNRGDGQHGKDYSLQ